MPVTAEPRPGQPRKLLAVWSATRAHARIAALNLQLDLRQVFAVGNGSADALRGLAVTHVLVLPGADSPEVEAALRAAARVGTRGPGAPWLDLRPVSL